MFVNEKENEMCSKMAYIIIRKKTVSSFGICQNPDYRCKIQ